MLDNLIGGGGLDGIINKLIEEQGGELLEGLVTRVGLSPEQAERFVPIAIKALVPMLKAKLLGEDDAPPAPDAASVAEAAAVSPEQARLALDDMAPKLEGQLGEQLKEGGLDALAGAAGDLLGGKGGLGGLFG